MANGNEGNGRKDEDISRNRRSKRRESGLNTNDDYYVDDADIEQPERDMGQSDDLGQSEDRNDGNTYREPKNVKKSNRSVEPRKKKVSPTNKTNTESQAERIARHRKNIDAGNNNSEPVKNNTDNPDTKKKMNEDGDKSKDKSKIGNKTKTDSNDTDTKGVKGFTSAKDVMSGKDSNNDKKPDDGNFVEDGKKVADNMGKVATGGALAGKGGVIGAGAMLASKGILMAKAGLAMVTGMLAKLGSIIVGGVQLVGSLIASTLALSALVSNVIASVLIAVVVGVVSVGGTVLVSEIVNRDDSIVNCVPSNTKVAKSSEEYIEEAEGDLVREENAIKLWSVYSQIGGTKEQTAAVLGNLQAESNLDPTSIETIYNEPFSIGPKKQSAIASDFQVGLIDSAYGNKYPAIKHVGIGLGQWTNGRNRLLVNYAKDNNLNWYDFDTQVMFMFDGDDGFRQKQLTNFLTGSSGNVEAEAEKFMNGWIGLRSPNPSLSARKKNAVNFFFTLERATVDVDYAEGILSGINVDNAEGNAVASQYHQDDGCGNAVLSHYANQIADGTGVVPPGLALHAWSPSTLPASLKPFSKDPTSTGLAYGNSSGGWYDTPNAHMAGQCVTFSSSYFMNLYPDWNKGGRPTSRPRGNGIYTSTGWATHYGEKTSSVPQAGSVFSSPSTSIYGHTGTVQHVFANGDILIIEQNVSGVSGAHANKPHTWGWRVILKEKYSGWKFFKPSGFEPKWGEGPAGLPSDSGNVSEALIVSIAKKYMSPKVPYVFGGDSMSGMDCSAYTRRVYKEIGIDLPRDTIGQAKMGSRIHLKNLKVGDLVIFSGTYREGPSHTGIYIGNNQFIHESSSSNGVTINNLSGYYSEHFTFGRRLF